MQDEDKRLKFDTRLGPRQWAKVNRSVLSGKRVVWPNGGVSSTKGLLPAPESYRFQWSGLYADDNDDGWVIQLLVARDNGRGRAHIYRFWRFDRERLQDLRRIGHG